MAMLQGTATARGIGGRLACWMGVGVRQPVRHPSWGLYSKCVPPVTGARGVVHSVRERGACAVAVPGGAPPPPPPSNRSRTLTRSNPRSTALPHIEHPRVHHHLWTWSANGSATAGPRQQSRWQSDTAQSSKVSQPAQPRVGAGGEVDELKTKPNRDDTSEAAGDRRERLLTIPNVLTISRLAATPYLGYLIVDEQWVAAFGLGFVAGVSDWLDGFIARRYPSQASVIGGVLDPIADKMMIMTVAVGLTVSGAIPWWLGGVIVGRDIWLLSTSLYIRHVSLRAHFEDVTWARYWDFGYPSVVVSPTTISKYNTVVQGLTLLCSLAAPATGWIDPGHPALWAIWGITATTTVASAASYAFANDALLFLRPPSTDLLHRLPPWAARRLEK